MGAATRYTVRVRKSYTCEEEVSAVTESEAHEKARSIPGVIMIEKIYLTDFEEG